MSTVLVTGGTTRLGRAIADHLRDVGWRVITSSHRPDAGADIIADFTEELGAVKCYAEVLRMLGGVPPDALVNNAALFSGDDIAIGRVNLEAPKKLTMLMAGRETDAVGAVVNIIDSRVTGNWAVHPNASAYERSKAELLEYTKKSAAMFVGSIRVNAVAPGPVLVPTSVREAAGETPLGRPKPIDVAKAVAFLLVADATTGCVISVDGGQSTVA